MKTTNVNAPGERSHGIVRGHVGQPRAGSPGITFRDQDDNESTSPELIVTGGTIIDGDDGTTTLVIDGSTFDGYTTAEADALFLTKASGEGHDIETATATATVTLDLSTANTFDVTLTANCTITLSNPPDSGVDGRWTLFLRQGGAGGWSVTMPAEVVWRDTDGTQTTTPPALATAPGAGDTIDLRTLDGGATYGASIENGSSGAAASGRWELAVITGSPPDPLYADGDYLYIFVP